MTTATQPIQTIEALIDAANEYQGDNIYQEFWYQQDIVDTELTEESDPGVVILSDGKWLVLWDESQKTWEIAPNNRPSQHEELCPSGRSAVGELTVTVGQNYLEISGVNPDTETEEFVSVQSSYHARELATKLFQFAEKAEAMGL